MLNFLHKLELLHIDAEFYIYGIGSCAQSLHEKLQALNYVNFKGFIDKTDSGSFCGYEVISKSQFFSRDDVERQLVVIASSFYEEILNEVDSIIKHYFIYPVINFEIMHPYNLHTYVFPTHPMIKEKTFFMDGYENEDQLKEIIQDVLDYTMVTYSGLLSIADMVAHIEKNQIGGDLVELGCAHGGTVGLMANANLAFSSVRRHIHAFDSFVGLPQPNKERDNSNQLAQSFDIAEEEMKGELSPVGHLVADKKNVEKLLFEKINYAEDYFHIYEGWFQDTLPVAINKIQDIAILRIDADLYDSTMIGMQYLYPKLKAGGFLILDDWVFEGARNAITDYFTTHNITNYRCRVDGTVCYWIKN